MRLITCISFIIFLIGCNSKSTLPPTQKDEPLKVSQKEGTYIFDEPQVAEAFVNLPETFCLKWDGKTYDDNTVYVSYTDTCSQNAEIIYTSVQGKQRVSFSRNLSKDSLIILEFFYQFDTLVTNGWIRTPKKKDVLTIEKINHLIEAHYTM